MSSSAKLYLCSNHMQSHFLQVSRTSVILLEILPFRTQTQKDEGDGPDWFTKSHLQELVTLLRQTGVRYYSSQEPAGTKCDKKLPSRFILTGATLRAACVFKNRGDDNICLVSKHLKGARRQYNVMNKLEDKMMIHVCPKTNSSVMNLSQLISSGASDDADNDLISKYFQPVASL